MRNTQVWTCCCGCKFLSLLKLLAKIYAGTHWRPCTPAVRMYRETWINLEWWNLILFDFYNRIATFLKGSNQDPWPTCEDHVSHKKCWNAKDGVSLILHGLSWDMSCRYVGPHLQDVVHYLATKYSNTSRQSIMFFAWKPSLVTTGLNNLTSISFPPCNLDLYCNYESRKLQKIVSNRLKEAKGVYEVSEL